VDKFQSTRPRGARRCGRPEPTTTSKFQSTRPRGARPMDRPEAGTGRVSIHAPTRGATVGGRKNKQYFCGFNPRAHAGRDNGLGVSAGLSRRFNPRAHAGRDFAQAASADRGVVSIHAPTRGATAIAGLLLPVFLFQSTRPRGARRQYATPDITDKSFNPRAHAGRDLRQGIRTGEGNVFQSTRPRGARRSTFVPPQQE